MAGHGGRRKGAGRPRGTDKLMVSLRLPLAWAMALRETARAEGKTQAAVVVEALQARGVVSSGTAGLAGWSKLK